MRIMKTNNSKETMFQFRIVRLKVTTMMRITISQDLINTIVVYLLQVRGQIFPK